MQLIARSSLSLRPTGETEMIDPGLGTHALPTLSSCVSAARMIAPRALDVSQAPYPAPARRGLWRVGVMKVRGCGLVSHCASSPVERQWTQAEPHWAGLDREMTLVPPRH